MFATLREKTPRTRNTAFLPAGIFIMSAALAHLNTSLALAEGEQLRGGGAGGFLRIDDNVLLSKVAGDRDDLGGGKRGTRLHGEEREGRQVDEADSDARGRRQEHDHEVHRQDGVDESVPRQSKRLVNLKVSRFVQAA